MKATTKINPKRLLIRLYILILIITALAALFSCGTRKTATDIERSDLLQKNEQSGSSQTTAESGTEATVDFSQILKNTGLEITSKGTPFSLSFAGITFTGDADMKINNSEQKTIYKTVYRHYNVYHNWNVYHSYDVTKTTTVHKQKETESERPSIWLIVALTIIVWESLRFLWRKYNPLSKITFSDWFEV